MEIIPETMTEEKQKSAEIVAPDMPLFPTFPIVGWSEQMTSCLIRIVAESLEIDASKLCIGLGIFPVPLEQVDELIFIIQGKRFHYKRQEKP